jgi:hypothetical protein
VYVQQLARGQPVALVVGDEDASAGADPDAIRLTQAARHGLDRAVARRDAHDAAAAGHLLGRARAAWQHGRGEVGVEPSILVHQAEAELVEVGRAAPLVGDRLVAVDDVVAVLVDEARQLVLLEHVITLSTTV